MLGPSSTSFLFNAIPQVTLAYLKDFAGEFCFSIMTLIKLQSPGLIFLMKDSKDRRCGLFRGQITRRHLSISKKQLLFQLKFTKAELSPHTKNSSWQYYEFLRLADLCFI